MNKIGGRKLAIFVIICFVQSFFTFASFVKPSQAVDDSIEITQCGQTLSTSDATYVLANDLLDCEGGGIIVTASNIIVDGNGHTISSSTINDAVGISIEGDNITVRNFRLLNFFQGVYFLSLTNGVIEGSTIEGSVFGIAQDINADNMGYICDFLDINGNTFLKNSTAIQFPASGVYEDISISNNLFDINDWGLTLRGSGYVLDGNTFANNSIDLDDTGSSATYLNNKFWNNFTNNRMISLNTQFPAKVTLGENVDVNFDLKSVPGNDCDDCTYEAIISGNDSWTSNLIKQGNNITGSFPIQKNGIYSVTIKASDSAGNSARRSYKFLSGETIARDETYYFRGINPTHGQPTSYPPNHNDAKALTLQEPVEYERWHCAQWIQNSIDDIPLYPFSNILRMNVNTWYTTKDYQGDGEKIAIQRYTNYNTPDLLNTDYDFSAPIVGPNTDAPNYTWLPDVQFKNLNWAMDYQKSWYWVGFKLKGNGDPTYVDENSVKVSWVTFPLGDTSGKKSHVDIVHEYATSPAIKSVSNDYLNILSATSTASDPNNATIVLDTTDLLAGDSRSTNITLDNFHRPFLGYQTTLSRDGTAVIAANDLSGQVTISSVPLDITPASGAITVNILDWEKSSSYYKRWTEAGSGVSSANHTVGNLSANKNYLLKVNGNIIGSYQADDQGQISFNYNQGYSTKTFEVIESSLPIQTDSKTNATSAADTISSMLITSYNNVLRNNECYICC